MANPYNDQRYAMARAMRQQKQTQTQQGLEPLAPAPSAAGLAYGRQAAKMASSNPSLRDAIDAIGQGKTQAPKGLLGSVLGNPIVHAGLKAAETLTLPARVVTSTVREAVDAIDGNKTTRASFGDFSKQIKDPSFRVATAFDINTGSKLLDGTLGFIGDVALDPITYMTFGAGSVGGYVGRMDLATRILGTGDSALAAAVAREGRSALIGQASKLEQVGANKFGVYMFGKRIKVGVNQTGIRIPLTGQIGQVGEKFLSKVRLGITDTKAGEWLQKMTLPKDFLEARIAVARGTASPAVAEGLLQNLKAGAVQKAFRGSVFNTLTNEVEGILKQETDLGNLESYRNSLYKFMQDPSLLNTASDAEVAGFNIWQPWLAKQAQAVQDGFKSIDPTADVLMRENYFPQVLTDEGIRYSRSETRYGQQLREILMADPLANPDSFTPRSLVPGKKFFGTVLQESDMNIDSLNKIANNGGFVGNFFETDVVVAMKKYTSDLADEFGIIERNRHLTESGFFKQIEEQRVLETSLNTDDIAAARSKVKEIKDSMDGAYSGMVAKNEELIDTLKTAYNNNVMNIHTVEETSLLIEDALRQYQTWLSGSKASISEAKNKLSILHGPINEIGALNVSDSFPTTILPVLKEYDSILNEVAVYESRINDLITQGSQEVGNNYLLSESIDTLQQSMDDLAERIKLGNDSVNAALEQSNVIESVWDSVSTGGYPREVAGQDFFSTIREILGYGSSTTPQAQLKAITKQIKVPGVEKTIQKGSKAGQQVVVKDFKNFVDSPEFTSLFDEISGGVLNADAPISRDRLKRISLPKHIESLNSLLSADVSLTEMRTQAAYAVARNAQLYGGDLPPTLKKFHNSLMKQLKVSAEVDSVTKRLAKKGTNANLTSFRGRWDTPMRQATQLQEGVSMFESLKTMLQRGGVLETALLSNPESGVERGLNFVDNGINIHPFTNDHVSLIASQAALMGHNEDDVAVILGEFLDNSDSLLNSSEPLIGDLNNAIERKLSELQAELDIPKYEFGAGKLKKGSVLSERRVLSSRDVLREHPIALAQAKAIDKSNAGDYLVPGMSVDDARIQLSASVMKYAAISDAVSKFEALSNHLSSAGLLVSEEMWHGILKTTHTKFGQGIGQKMSNLVHTEDLLREMQSDYHKIFALGDKSQHEAFVEAYTVALSKEGGENLREVVGKHLNTLDQEGNPMLIDPVDMALKIKSQTSIERGLKAGLNAGTATQAEKNMATKRLKDYYKDVVIPWAKQVDPSETATKTGADKVLKRFVSSTNQRDIAASVSPLSVRAETRSVEKWFNQFFDTKVPVDNYVDGRLVRSEFVKKGLLSNTYDAYSKHYTFFNDLNDGYLDPQSFFNYHSGVSRVAPTDTPSSYGLQMAVHAKNIQRTVDQLVSEKLVKENAKLVKTATSASESAARAKQLQDAFKDPTLDSDALKELGFTKDMKAARDATLAHQAHIATGAYAKALQDKETVGFLESAAVYDFHLFDEGFVVGSNSIPVYQDTVKDVQRTAVVSKRDNLTKALQNISDEENQAVLEINRKYVLQQKDIVTGGVPSNQIKFKSVEARTAYKREMALFESRSKPSFDARRAAIQRDLDELPTIASDTVTMAEGEVPAFTPRARTQIGTRNEPVFAKMPDGQRIVFSRAESESLFAVPLLPLEVKAVRGEIRVIKSRLAEVDRLSSVYKNNNARLVGLDREAESLAASLLPLEHKLLVSDMSTRQMALYKASQLVHGNHWPVDAPEARTNFLQGWSNLDVAYKPKRGKISKGLKSTEKVIDPADDLKANTTISHYINRDNVRHGVTAPKVGEAPTEWQRTQTLIESLNQNTEEAAKAVLDFASLKESERLANQAIVDSKLHYTPARYHTSTDVGIRRNNLQSSWGKTKEFGVIQTEQELGKQASLNKATQAVNSNSKLLQKTASDAQKVADESSIRLDDLQIALRDSSMAISKLEPEALKAAGIEQAFDFAGPIAPSSFTVNNRTYLVPSFTEMLSNPGKWAKEYLPPSVRGGKPGAKYKLFDELTKPVMRPVFDDIKKMQMHEQASFALQMAHSAFDDGVLLNVKKMILSNAGERIGEIQNLLTSHMDDVSTLKKSLDAAKDALKAEQQMAQKELTKATLEKAIGAPEMFVTTSGGKKISVSQLETEQDFFQFAEEIKQLYGSNLTPEQILSNPNNLISTLKHRQSFFDQLDLNGLWSKDLAKNIDQWKFQNNEVMRSIVRNADDPEGMAVTAALTQAHAAEGRFLSEQLRLGAAQKNLAVALTPKETEKMVKMLADGFVSAGNTFNLPGLSVNKEVASIITNVARISDGRTARELGQFLGKYTSFFKAYSTLSPGFHVRNAMSNTFQMFAAGTEAKNMIEGLRLYTGFGEALRRGGNLEDWLMTVPEALRPQAKIAMDVHMALGGGKVEDAFSEFLTTTKGALSDNPLTRGSRKLGSRVEGSARFTLAFDSAQKGMDFYSSFNKTKRFLFDYSETSALDDSVKNIIPFWTWMSRNLPLQIANQWTNPKPYAIYNHFSENFGISKDEIVPQWMRDQGALSIGGDKYITPDIPSLKAQEMVAQLASPKKMLSYVNPLMRVPLELAGGTKFFNDSKFSDKYTVLDGKWAPFIPLLAAMGQVETNDKGQYITSSKSIYGLTSMIPTLGQGERIFPSSDISGGDGYAFQRYLGMPIRGMNAEAKDNVLKQQLNQLLALQGKQQRMNEAG